MPGKRDSFGRSTGQIYGENGSPVPLAMVSVPYSFGRSVEKICGGSGFRRGSCGLGVFLRIVILVGYIRAHLSLPAE